VTDSPLRIGLLGASKIAPLAVIEPAAARPDVVITAVAARDPDRARAFAQQHGIPSVAADYAELVQREDVDLVYNGLPPAAHPQWSVAALQHGKMVLCEKPLTRTAAEATAMADAAARAGGVLIEAFHYRHHRVMREAVAAVRRGDIGRPRRAEAVFNVPIARTETELRWRRDLGGGALMDLGCYPLHALRSLLTAEPVVEHASARFEPDGVDAELEVKLSFGDVSARIACSMIAPRAHAALWIEGDAGRLGIVNFVAPQIGCVFTVNGETRRTDGPPSWSMSSGFGGALSRLCSPLRTRSRTWRRSQRSTRPRVEYEPRSARAGRHALVARAT
jgi:predicted dehydrogenase